MVEQDGVTQQRPQAKRPYRHYSSHPGLVKPHDKLDLLHSFLNPYLINLSTKLTWHSCQTRIFEGSAQKGRFGTRFCLLSKSLKTIIPVLTKLFPGRNWATCERWKSCLKQDLVLSSLSSCWLTFPPLKSTVASQSEELFCIAMWQSSLVHTAFVKVSFSSKCSVSGAVCVVLVCSGEMWATGLRREEAKRVEN